MTSPVGAQGDGRRRVREKDIVAWRLCIAHAQPVPLGAFDWPRILGFVLDDMESDRARLAAVEAALLVGGQSAGIRCCAAFAALGYSDQAGGER